MTVTDALHTIMILDQARNDSTLQKQLQALLDDTAWQVDLEHDLWMGHLLGA
jgi:hypothetical protein